MLKEFFKFILVEVIYNGHLQCMSAVGIAISSALLLNVKISWPPLVILYLSFYLIYLYNRYKEIDHDFLTNRTRSEHIRKMDKYVTSILAVNTVLVAILLSIFANLHLSLIHI